MFFIRKRSTKRKDSKGKTKNRYQAIINVIRNGSRFYKAVTCDSQKEAEKRGRELLAEIDKGIVTKESLKRRKLSEAIQKYIDTILLGKPKDAKNVTRHLKWWNEQIGQTLLSELFPPLIADCRDRLLNTPTYKGTKRSTTTVVKYLNSLSVVLETAVKEWMWISQNPVKQIKKPPIRKGRTLTYTPEEIRKILDCCDQIKSPYLSIILRIACGTGMRKAEIEKLRYKHLDFKNRLFLLDDTKNGEPRNVPMSDTIYEMLVQFTKDQKEGAFKKSQRWYYEVPVQADSLLFPSPTNPKKPISFRTSFEKVLKLAGIKQGSFHTFRHTVCSLLSAQKFTGINIAKLSGHSDDNVTNRVYTHLVPETAREMVRHLDLVIQKKVNDD